MPHFKSNGVEPSSSNKVAAFRIFETEYYTRGVSFETFTPFWNGLPARTPATVILSQRDLSGRRPHFHPCLVKEMSPAYFSLLILYSV